MGLGSLAAVGLLLVCLSVAGVAHLDGRLQAATAPAAQPAQGAQRGHDDCPYRAAPAPSSDRSF